MSKRATYNYSAIAAAARVAASAVRKAEAERQAAEWSRRTAQITREHLERYRTILDDLHEQGLDEWAQDEITEVSELIERARTLVHTDPASARDISRRIGPLIGPLPRAARQLRATTRASPVEGNVRSSATHRTETRGNARIITSTTDSNAQKQPIAAPAENPVEVAWREAMSEWTDFLARDLAHVELTSLREQIHGPGGINRPEEVMSKIGGLRAKWEKEAAKQRQDEVAVLAMQQELAEEAPPEPGESAAHDEPELGLRVEPEEARRDAVRAVMNALEDAGFRVESPRRVTDSTGADEVVVVGTRPSGASATFNLTLDGALEYDFSGYKGSSCDADIDAVVPALQEIYGIQLTDEVVAWRNPDSLDADARPRPGKNRKA